MSAESEEFLADIRKVLQETTGADEASTAHAVAALHPLLADLWDHVAEEASTAAYLETEGRGEGPLVNPFALAVLPHGRYFDGTYEWDYDEAGWTPLRAPSGMPSEPERGKLKRVVVSYEAL